MPISPPSISISREAEIAAIDAANEIAALPNRNEIVRANIEKLPSEIQLDVTAGKLTLFAPGWAIIGNKPGGVEGGCIIRRVYHGPVERFPCDCREGFEQLLKMSAEDSLLLPDALRRSNLGDRDLVEAFSDLTLSEQIDLSRLVMDQTPSFRKSYMVKVIFGRENVSADGSRFYKPRAKNTIRKYWTSRTLEQVNREVLNEFCAMKIARQLSPEIAPESFVGVVVGGIDRWFIATELGASDMPGARFCTIADCDADVLAKLPGHGVGISFALTAGLLGDRDANGDPNVGVIIAGDGTHSLFHFDLGHPDPNRFDLDVKTLLPKNISDGSIGFRLGRLHKNKTVSTVDVRRIGLTELYERRAEIFATVDRLIDEAGDNPWRVAELTKMKAAFTKRIDYVGRVLAEHMANARAELAASIGKRFYVPPMPTAM
ncbi:MAG: hypothetical protein LBB38_00690 [Puniceicoccales bacterium]|jgi:hypothetical protein|nr:hypothetical protein [Puniceicoccales bacterium]